MIFKIFFPSHDRLRRGVASCDTYQEGHSGRDPKGTVKVTARWTQNPTGRGGKRKVLRRKPGAPAESEKMRAG